MSLHSTRSRAEALIFPGVLYPTIEQFLRGGTNLPPPNSEHGEILTYQCRMLVPLPELSRR